MRIVVDTSVALSASEKEPPHPVGQNCAIALNTIKDTAVLSVAVTDELLAEWFRPRAVAGRAAAFHASSFSIRWLTMMQSSGRVQKLPAEDAELDEHIETHANTGEQNALRHDAHVIKAALASDFRCISTDDRMKTCHLPALARRLERIRQIHWANPVVDHSNVVNWLQRGAPDQEDLRIQ